ncbi:hypothetical protein [Candidatus Mycoplasma mahonii]|uniref:hypothetical protein n=1 Tax=Candidatus Mycoplasma mahonii TaxID=3004105 RepID=UPI0026F0DF6F|nr:hypothetical protein [Candidatus Mycoplasma mahonii]WKX02741.1 hypothetical protein O3I44_01565 [Candidatus Mycoplasma mahonii]
MKRNIATTIQFTKKKIFLIVIESIATNKVEIFSSSAHLHDASSFLDEALREANAIIGGVIEDVSVVVNSSKETKASIKPFLQSIKISGTIVSEVDIENAVQLTKSSFEEKGRKVILVQPIKYKVFDILWKSYDKAPINKTGSKLKVTSVVTTIAFNIYEFITQLINSKNLKINKFLLSHQAISQNNLSESALAEGAILIHVEGNETFITINKNSSTIASMSIYDFGFKSLEAGISKLFGCSKEEAKKMITLYGSFNQNINRVIFRKYVNHKEKLFMQTDLNKIIDSFVEKLLMVSKQFITQKKVSMLPIIISGRVEQIDGILEFAKASFGANHVSIYNPLTYISASSKNICAIGITLFNERINEILGRQNNTIVETNPQRISSLKKEDSKNNIMKRIIEKLGGKNVWK